LHRRKEKIISIFTADYLPKDKSCFYHSNTQFLQLLVGDGRR
jgi:hypothetical protein